MRILSIGSMYPPHSLGGYERAWAGWVGHARAAGHEVRVLTTGFTAPGVEAGDEPEVSRDLRWYWHDHRWPDMSRAEVRALEEHNAAVLAARLEEFAPDACCWWAMGGMSLASITSAHARGIPAVAVLGDDWPAYGPKVDRAWRARHRLPFGPRLEPAADWVFVSEFLRRSLAERGFTPDRSTVIHNGIDLARFSSTPPGEWGWRLLCVGRLDERKGTHLGIEALRHLPDEATLLLVGDGEADYRSRLEQLAGTSGSVRFDVRDHAGVAAAYAECDAVLFPVLWEEPFGMVPLEAMASGRPVVATGTGGSAEFLADGENCVLFARESGADGLAAAVRRVAGDPALRERLRTEGLETAARFPESAFTAGVLGAIEQAVRIGPR